MLKKEEYKKILDDNLFDDEEKKKLVNDRRQIMIIAVISILLLYVAAIFMMINSVNDYQDYETERQKQGMIYGTLICENNDLGSFLGTQIFEGNGIIINCLDGTVKGDING